jgi:hypothetical protein
VAERLKFSYERGQDDVFRPYLWLDVRTEGGHTTKVRGLLDSGADVSLMGVGYAEALGLAPGDFDEVSTRGPAGQVPGKQSRKIIYAILPGAGRRATELRPIFFEGGLGARWGRDFMNDYRVAFDQPALQFSLFVLEPEP